LRFALSFLLLCVATAAQTADIEGVLKQAIALHQAGDITAAIAAYEKYLAQRPDSPLALQNLGAAYARSGRYQEAIARYDRALELQPGNSALQLNLGLAYYKSGRMNRAASLFEKVHQAAPGDKQPVLLLADTWLAMGRYKDVDTLLTPIHEKNPDDKAVTYMLGTALVRGGQVERGQAIIDQILRNGDSAEARLLLGVTKLNAREYPAALADLKRAVELNPALPDVYAYYGQALEATGDPARALEAYRKAIDANPADFLANREAGVLLKNEQKFDEALVYLDRALQTRPHDLDARYNVSSIHVQQGNLNTALQQLESMTKEAPEFRQAHVTLATVYYRLKRKSDGDRERAIVQNLTDETQKQQQKGYNIK